MYVHLECSLYHFPVFVTEAAHNEIEKRKEINLMCFCHYFGCYNRWYLEVTQSALAWTPVFSQMTRGRDPVMKH